MPVSKLASVCGKAVSLTSCVGNASRLVTRNLCACLFVTVLMTPWMDSTFTPLVGLNYYCAPYWQNERFGNPFVRVTKLLETVEVFL